LPKWDSLNAEEKKMYAREAEVFAGYTAYTDYEIGRVIQGVEDMGKLDNTLIIYIVGDNGTSAEGSLYGTFNQLTAYNGILTDPAVKAVKVMNALHYENWGSDKTYPHMSVAWSWAFDTPFKWTKQVASHFGGTRQGLAISWPGTSKTWAEFAPSSITSSISSPQSLKPLASRLRIRSTASSRSRSKA
jgi:arylsulfatase A-like enzyme